MVRKGEEKRRIAGKKRVRLSGVELLTIAQVRKADVRGFAEQVELRSAGHDEKKIQRRASRRSRREGGRWGGQTLSINKHRYMGSVIKSSAGSRQENDAAAINEAKLYI